MSGRLVTILMAEDDPDDQVLTRDALNEARLSDALELVEDGQELLDYLRREGSYSKLVGAPLPAVVLLDLNMPRLNGWEALQQIKTDPVLRKIPIVILATSGAEEDVDRAYDLGANSYITKPGPFEGLVEVMKAIGRYWFEIAELPSPTDSAS